MYGSRGTPRKSRTTSGTSSGSRLAASDVTSKGTDSLSIMVDTEEGDGNRVRINYSKLKTLVATFAQYKDTPIKDLPEDLRHQLHLVGRIFSFSHESDFYPNLIESVKTSFGDMKTATAGTVGGFFRGCFLPSAYSGSLHCSAECSGAIKPPNVAGWQTCAHNVALLTAQGELEMQHRVSSSNHLILHVLGVGFSGLTASQVGELRRAGITRVDIDLVMPDSKYKTISEGLPLEDVPVVGAGRPGNTGSKSGPSDSSFESASGYKSDDWDSQDDGDHHQRPPRSHKPPQDDGWNLSGVLLAIIFIVVIVAVIVVLFAVFRRRPRSDVDMGTFSGGGDVTGVAATPAAATAPVASDLSDPSSYWSS